MTESQSAYELMGGPTRLRALVDRFYDLMDSDPEFAGIRAMHPPALDQSREKLLLFMSGWAGGPDAYTERFGPARLRAGHLPFAIGSSERDQWLRAMAWAMQDIGLDEPLQLRLMEALYRVADSMRNQPD